LQPRTGSGAAGLAAWWEINKKVAAWQPLATDEGSKDTLLVYSKQGACTMYVVLPLLALVAS